MKRSASRLQPLPGATNQTSMAQLNTSTKQVGYAMARLLSAASKGDDPTIAYNAAEACVGLKQLTGGIHGVAASRADPNNDL